MSFFSMCAICIFIIVIILSIIIANIAEFSSREIHQKIGKKTGNNEILLEINDEPDHLMWFVQISDLHISIFTSPDRIEQFKDFVNNTIDIIRPSIVLASGDLTDAKDRNILGSRQYEEEWKIYKSVLDSVGIKKKTDWLDIRGNHDYFNVPHIDSEMNYFRKYSIQGPDHKRSYLHMKSVGGEKYSFIAVDACLEPGPKRPYNFVGILTEKDIKEVIDLHEVARKRGSNYTITFGHYPTSCILTPRRNNLREILGSFDDNYAYLCGHLHTQAGIVNRMYALQKDGFLELELGDWKENRLFRIAAFDHGLFSFVDVHYNEWPIILITNPKNVLTNLPNKEDINLQLNSQFIRFLIFSNSEVQQCLVIIENKDVIQCEKISENLYVAPWNPEKYKTGLNTITVEISTKNGKNKKMTQLFSLDGSTKEFDFLAKFFLMSSLTNVLQAGFALALSGCTLPLCICRIIHELIRAEKIKKFRPRRIKPEWLKNFVQKIWILSTVDKITWPLLIYCIYISIGPWNFGEILDDHFGIVFIWGMFLKTKDEWVFFPGNISYFYGFFQLTFCQFPLTLILGNKLHNRYQIIIANEKPERKLIKYLDHIPFFIIMCLETLLAITFWSFYGIIAFLLGPFRTWSVVLHMVLYLMSFKVSEKNLSSAKEVWSSSIFYEANF